MGDKPQRAQVEVRDDSNGQGGRDHPAANLYADADLSKRENVAAKSAPKIDVEGTYGSEADFLKSAPTELRQQLGLKPDATADQVYHKMAKDMVRLFPGASREMQQEALSSLGLKRGDLSGKAAEDNAYNALIARDRRETGTANGASLSELETAVHRRTYRQMKDGTIPIDYD